MLFEKLLLILFLDLNCYLLIALVVIRSTLCCGAVELKTDFRHECCKNDDLSQGGGGVGGVSTPLNLGWGG